MSRRDQAIVFVWREIPIEGGTFKACFAMVPVPRYANVAKRQFVEGHEYVLEQASERSMASHSQFFAALNDYFDNLPETIAARWPTANHFRRWLLCETGWFDEKEFDLISEKHAKALAAFIRTEDDYARIVVRNKKVIVRRAKSQSLKAMGKEDFQKSKNDVLDLAAQFVGVPRAMAMKEAGRSA